MHEVYYKWPIRPSHRRFKTTAISISITITISITISISISIITITIIRETSSSSYIPIPDFGNVAVPALCLPSCLNKHIRKVITRRVALFCLLLVLLAMPWKSKNNKWTWWKRCILDGNFEDFTPRKKIRLSYYIPQIIYDVV